MFHNQKVSHVICISKKPSAKPHWTEQTWISASLDTAGRAILSSPLPSSLPPLLTSRSHCYGGVGGVGGGMLKMNPLSGQEHPYTERRKDFSTSLGNHRIFIYQQHSAVYLLPTRFQLRDKWRQTTRAVLTPFLPPLHPHDCRERVMLSSLLPSRYSPTRPKDREEARNKIYFNMLSSEVWPL